MTDPKRFRRLWWVRLLLPVWMERIWLIVVTGLVVWALVHIQSDVDRQREGRHVAIQATCGFDQAVIDAGRAALLSGVNVQPPAFERNLIRIGLPPRRFREAAAKAAAVAYSRRIAQAVEQASGVRGLVLPDGRLDCSRLVRAAEATP